MCFPHRIVRRKWTIRVSFGLGIWVAGAKNEGIIHVAQLLIFCFVNTVMFVFSVCVTGYLTLAILRISRKYTNKITLCEELGGGYADFRGMFREGIEFGHHIQQGLPN